MRMYACPCAQNHAEEITHVAAGVRWFVHVCAARGVADPVAEFHRIVRSKFGSLKPPFNDASRLAAGMTPEWYMPLATAPTPGAGVPAADGSDED